MVNQEWRRIAPETLIYLARAAPHDIDNDGGADLSFAWIVTPPGLDTLVGSMGRPCEPQAVAPSPFDAPSDAPALYRRAGLTPLHPAQPSA